MLILLPILKNGEICFGKTIQYHHFWLELTAWDELDIEKWELVHTHSQVAPYESFVLLGDPGQIREGLNLDSSPSLLKLLRVLYLYRGICNLKGISLLRFILQPCNSWPEQLKIIASAQVDRPYLRKIKDIAMHLDIDYDEIKEVPIPSPFSFPSTSLLTPALPRYSLLATSYFLLSTSYSLTHSLQTWPWPYGHLVHHLA